MRPAHSLSLPSPPDKVVFSPIFGIIANKMGRVRPLALLLSLIFCAGNIFYANLALIPNDFANMDTPRVSFAMLARAIVGIGTSQSESSQVLTLLSFPNLNIVLFLFLPLPAPQGINVVARLYVAKVTTKEERTTHTAFLSAGQSLGLILGPAIQEST